MELDTLLEENNTSINSKGIIKEKKKSKINCLFFIFFMIIIILQTLLIVYIILLSKYIEQIDINQINDDLKLIGNLNTINFNKLDKTLDLVYQFNNYDMDEFKMYLNKSKHILDFVCSNYIHC